MTDQLTEVDLAAENELICEKLLCWKQHNSGNHESPGVWIKPATETRREEQWYTPSFDTWADAGLILDALKAAGEKPRVFIRADDQWGCMGWHCGGVGSTAFAAIRAAALEYIRSRP